MSSRIPFFKKKKKLNHALSSWNCWLEMSEQKSANLSLFLIISFIYFFGRAGSFLLHRLFSSCGEQGLLWCEGFFLWWLLLLCSMGSKVCGLRHSTACGILPDQGSNPCIPALAGGFLTTWPPGKSLPSLFWWTFLGINFELTPSSLPFYSPSL